MPEFQTPVDIGNRALQRVGAQMLDAILGFADGSNNANQVSFCYGKLRRAELQRNVWTFATRKAALRPVDINTALLQPTLYDASVTYFVGSVIADQAGTLWESIQRNNLANDPQNSPLSWQPYFGPMTSEQFTPGAFFTSTSTSAISASFTNTVMPFAPGYFNGEMVHTIKGDGTYNVYRSMLDGNAVHPALPNQWSVNTRYKTDDVVNVYPAWSSLTTYSKGQTVNLTDASGNVTTWSSLTNNNLNNSPAAGVNWSQMPTLTLQTEVNPALISQPQIIPGISPINEWDIFTSYSTGNFVIWNATIYLALANSTGVYPSNATSWVATSGGTLYQSLIDFNAGNNPASAPVLWSSGTTYSSGTQVGASNGVIYTSAVNSNVGHDPTLDNGTNWTNTGVLNPWTTVFTLGGGNSLWIQVGGSAFPNGVGISTLQITYPVGCGPLSQNWTKNIYRLPGNYLRKAPEQPRAGITSWLGAPGNLQSTDWTYEGDYLTSWNAWPIILRFVADVQDVTKYPDTFAEGLACRIALEVCEPLTQSTAKLQVIGQEYKKFMTEAIQINAIEQGPVTPPLDDLIDCRR